MTVDYQVQLIQLPSSKTKELVVPNEDGSYTIFIEASLAHDAQQEAFKHALKHILGNDFEKYDISQIERMAHNFEASSEICLTL